MPVGLVGSVPGTLEGICIRLFIGIKDPTVKGPHSRLMASTFDKQLHPDPNAKLPNLKWQTLYTST